MAQRTEAEDAGSASTPAREPYRARGLQILALLGGLVVNLSLGLSRIDISEQELIDTDGYMRYARILDLVQGRNGWFDGWIHWSNSPYGHSMHWTRLLDGMVIVLAAPLAPFVGWSDAIYWAGLASGPLLHLTLITVVIWTAHSFVSSRAAALAGSVVALQPLVVGYSSLGRLDHHLLLTVLAIASLGCTLQALRSNLAASAAAGCLAGLAMWVSTEALLPVALSGGALVALWVVTGGSLAPLQRWSLALAATMVVAVFLEHGPGDLTAIEYDRLSLPHVITALAGLAAVWAATFVMHRRPEWTERRMTRFAGLATCLAIPLITVVLAYPGLRRGPFADTPRRVWDIWLSHVTESQPMWTGASPVGVMIVQIGTPIIGLVCAVVLMRRSPQHLLWVTLAVWLAVTIPLALHSTRLALYPEALAAVPVAAMAYDMILRHGRGPSLRRMLIRTGIATVAVTGNLLGGVLASIGSRSTDALDAAECGAAGLAPVIAGTVPEDTAILAHIDEGPILHVTTGRAVIATPHHRNVDGILAAYDIMRSTLEDALVLIRDRRIGAVVVCPQRDREYLAPLPADSLALALIDGSPPPWLREVATGDREVRLFVVTL